MKKDGGEMRHEERLLWLAEQESATSMLKFPMLRKACPNCRGQITEYRYKNSDICCSPCDNRGWMPEDSLEATIKACYLNGYTLTMNPKTPSLAGYITLKHLTGSDSGLICFEDNLNETLIRVLYFAERLKGGD